MEIFVSQLCMPPDMQFDSGSESPAFVSADQELRIVKGSLIIVKIVGIRPAANEISVVGSINEDYLGPVED